MIIRPEMRQLAARAARRAGTSLLEVLVALGIMAVGALGAFVLFPVASINMSRALIDDRATTCAISADGQIRDVHKRYVVETEFNGTPSTEPYWLAFDTATPATAAAPGGVAPLPHEPSVPVVVDPMGMFARPTAFGGPSTVGDNNGTLVPRRNLSFINTSTLGLRFCSQTDGLTYTEGGTVDSSNISTMRELRYNWLWVLQRPVNRDKYTVRQQVVVFDKRVHLYAPPGSEATYPAAFIPGSTVIGGIPNTAEGMRKGAWIMDATIGTDVAGRVVRNAEFYRITSVTEDTTTNPATYQLEVHKPIARADGQNSLSNPASFGYIGSLVLMPTVVEVFERPPLTGNAQ